MQSQHRRSPESAASPDRCRAVPQTHPQAVTEVLLEGGVVGFRGGDVGFEQHPAVDGQPASVEGLDLVRDRDVGMEVWVAGPAVPVGERGGDQASDVDLADALRSGRVSRACFSMNAKASLTASWWARSITAATAGSATAHNVETDFTGENVRS
jgi:hypothetical protein